MSKSKLRATDDLRTRFRPTCDDITFERGLETHSLGVSRDGDDLVNVPRNPAFKRDKGVVARPYLNTSARKSRRPGCASGLTANFSVSINGLEVTFTDTSTGASSYAWDFGDTNTSSAPSPQHTYGTANTFTVKLTITGAGGQTASKTINVTVAAALPNNFNIKMGYTFGCDTGGPTTECTPPNGFVTANIQKAQMGQIIEVYTGSHGNVDDVTQLNIAKEKLRGRRIWYEDDNGVKRFLEQHTYDWDGPDWKFVAENDSGNAPVWNNPPSTIPDPGPHIKLRWRDWWDPNTPAQDNVGLDPNNRIFYAKDKNAYAGNLIKVPEFKLDPSNPSNIIFDKTVAQEKELIGWWKFDEPQAMGNIALDWTETENEALRNCTPHTGKNGTAMVFANSSTHMVVPAHATYPSSADFSMGAWVQWDGTVQGAITIFSTGDYRNVANGTWMVRISNPTSLPTLDFLAHNGASDIATSGLKNIPSGGLTAGQWHHVMLVYKAAANEARLYWDGAQLGSNITLTDKLKDQKTNGVYIGAQKRAGSGFQNAHDNPWRGKIDDVRLYKIELSDSDVTTAFGNGNGDWW